jgi:hypothetical protein
MVQPCGSNWRSPVWRAASTRLKTLERGKKGSPGSKMKSNDSGANIPLYSLIGFGETNHNDGETAADD